MGDNPYSLSFTCDYHRERVTFLDLSISLDRGGFVNTKLYRKTTAVNSLLHAESFNPGTWIRNILVGQYLRTGRNSMEDSDFEQEARVLRNRFHWRG